MEDALELWLVVIQNSTTLTPELLELSRNILPIIGEFHRLSRADTKLLITCRFVPEQKAHRKTFERASPSCKRTYY